MSTECVTDVGAHRTRLTVRHPSVTRPAVASPFEIVVERAGGFDGEIDVAVDVDHLAMWDLNGIIPAPSAERSAGDRVVWTFEPPDGAARSRCSTATPRW